MRHPNEPNTALNLKFWWQPVLLSIRQACTLLGLEDPIQIGSGREATLGRNDIIAIIRIIQHHLLCCIETDLAEPYSECRLHTLIEEYRQFLLGDTQCAGEGQHIHSTVLISQISTPFVKTLPDKVDALL